MLQAPGQVGFDVGERVGAGDARGTELAGAVRSVLTDPALAARLAKAAADLGNALPSEDDAVTAALAEYEFLTRTRR